MQNYITENDLFDLGFQPDDPELEKILSELNERVANLIGEEIIDSLTPSDVDILSDMQDKASDQEIVTWITEHVPDYPEIIDTNIDIVMGEFVEQHFDTKQ